MSCKPNSEFQSFLLPRVGVPSSAGMVPWLRASVSPLQGVLSAADVFWLHGFLALSAPVSPLQGILGAAEDVFWLHGFLALSAALKLQQQGRCAALSPVRLFCSSATPCALFPPPALRCWLVPLLSRPAGSCPCTFPALLPRHCSVPLLAIKSFLPRRTGAFGTLYISLITRSYFSVH